jgi:Chaperone of endosialidase
MCFGATNILGNCTSDRRLKRNVEYLEGGTGLAAVMRLKPAAFRWHDGDDRVMAGFVAQDTAGAIPAAVHRPAGSEFLALDTGAVLAYAVKAIQELQAEVERLKAAR